MQLCELPSVIKADHGSIELSFHVTSLFIIMMFSSCTVKDKLN